MASNSPRPWRDVAAQPHPDSPRYCLGVAFSQQPKDKEQPPKLAVVRFRGSTDLYFMDGAIFVKREEPLWHPGELVNCIAFSPAEDGRLLASGIGNWPSKGKTVRLWDTQTAQSVAVLEGHSDTVKCVAFSPDGSLLATGSADKTVRLWDIASRAAVGPVLHGHTALVCSVAFSPSGRLLASASDDCTVRLWSIFAVDGMSMTLLCTPGPVLRHDHRLECIAFSPSAASNLLASGSRKGIIRLWDVSGDGFLVRELKGHCSSVHSIAFSPNGSQLASGSEDTTVKLWRVQSGNLLEEIKYKHSVCSVAFHPNGNQVVVAISQATVVWNWTVCEWSDRLHHLFGPELKRVVFRLMCVKMRQDVAEKEPRLPMQLWLRIFQNIV